MSNHVPRGPYPGRRLERPHLRRFDAGRAANDDVPPLPPVRPLSEK